MKNEKANAAMETQANEHTAEYRSDLTNAIVSEMRLSAVRTGNRKMGRLLAQAADRMETMDAHITQLRERCKLLQETLKNNAEPAPGPDTRGEKKRKHFDYAGTIRDFLASGDESRSIKQEERPRSAEGWPASYCFRQAVIRHGFPVDVVHASGYVVLIRKADETGLSEVKA